MKILIDATYVFIIVIKLENGFKTINVLNLENDNNLIYLN